MFIESLIKRKAGTTVTLGDNTYRFNAENNHTCEVTNENHAIHLLAITNGFQQIEQPTLDPAVNEVATGSADDERAALVALYVAKFGKAPHPRAGIAKIKAELDAE